MRKALITLLIMAFVFNIAGARKKSKAGKIVDGVYTDKKHDFSLVIPDKWDKSIKKDKDKVRLVLTKKQFDIPNDYRHAPSYTQVPKVIVYVDTSSMNPTMFIDSLVSDKYKSKQKNKMFEEFKILYGDFIPKRKSKMSISDIEGMRISGERRYSINVQRRGIGGDLADLVSDYYGGSLFITKKDDNLIIFHFICEKRYFVTEDADFVKLLNGFKFIKK
jgi:hypothetical protein